MTTVWRPPTWPRPPDGMLPQDFGCWFAFQRQATDRYLQLAFNVPLPTLNPLPTLDDSDAARAFLDANRKRIDVLAMRQDGTVEIIEVATTPSLRAIGQLLTYEALYTRVNDPPLAALHLVCRQLDADLHLALADHSITVSLV